MLTQKNIHLYKIIFLSICCFLLFSCQNSLFKSIDDVISGPAPPQVTGDERTNDPRPVWTWTLSEDATNVRYQLGTESPNSWITAGGTNVRSFTPSEDLAEGNYTLYVQASNVHNIWSNSGTLEIIVDFTKPDVPVVSGPSGTITARPRWEWDINPEVEFYRIGFTDGNWIKQDLTDNFYIHDLDLPDGSYTLYVQALDFAGNWSSTGQHTLIVDGTIPAMLEPLGIVSGVQPVFKWSASTIPNAVYTIQISSDQLFTGIIGTIENLFGLEYLLAEPLTENNSYFWRIKILDETGLESTYTQPAAFEIPETQLDIGLTIDIPIQADIPLDSSTTQLIKGSNLILTVAPPFSYDEISWYLDGVKIEDENGLSLTYGETLPIGNYIITVAIKAGSTIYTEEVVFAVRL